MHARLSDILKEAEPIGLAQMDSVSLQNRIDKKYMLHITQLPEILRAVLDNYYVLEIGDHRVFSYKTVYFDTADFRFYKDHHNGMGNRIKVRCREYVETGNAFFEIKQKTQGDRTSKYRKTIQALLEGLGSEEYGEVRARYQKHEIDGLKVTLNNFFYRITLVNKKLTERATIDFGLKFSNDRCGVEVADVAIIEVKQGKYDEQSHLVQALKKARIFPHNISKYIYGLLLTDNGVKQNAFKQILQKVNKIQSTNGSH